jgi:hypothetical protein
MWAAWVIRDVSTRGKASENAAAKSYWMNGWENQNGLTKGPQKSALTRAEELRQIATLLIDEHLPLRFFQLVFKRCQPRLYFLQHGNLRGQLAFLVGDGLVCRSQGKVSRGLLRRISCNFLSLNPNC